MNHNKCNQIIISQGFQNGIMGGPYHKEIDISENLKITIDQSLKRTITISSKEEIKAEDLFYSFQPLEKLLMLFDGRFYPISDIKSDNDSLDDEHFKNKILSSRLRYFNSADICQSPVLRLIQFQDILDDDIYTQWADILDEMGIMYQSYLYSLSDNSMPRDINYAFIAEAAEPFVELVKDKTYYCKSLSPGERGTTLKMCIDSLITHFGEVIFSDELNNDYDKFLTKAVKSRVRIMHIKRFQDNHFDGADCIRYLWKFSLLYRRILLEILGIPYQKYCNQLKTAVNTIDKWNR